MNTIPPGVAEQLGYYVYLYVDPRNDSIFYVGKGKGERILDHLGLSAESRKTRVISELHSLGLEPRLEILAHRLIDEATAFRVEAAVIDALGLGSLTNECRGWQSVALGRMPLSQLSAYYAAPPVTLVHPAILVRINRRYWHGMPPDELYEATRGVWKIGPRRRKAQLALAIFEAVVREVYTIESWHPAGSTPYRTRPSDSVGVSGRWEFSGSVAPEAIRTPYLGGSVLAYLPKGSQNPIAYVNA